MLVKQGDMGYFLLPFVLQHVLEFQARRELCSELRSTATGTRSIFIRKKKKLNYCTSARLQTVLGRADASKQLCFKYLGVKAGK